MTTRSLPKHLILESLRGESKSIHDDINNNLINISFELKLINLVVCKIKKN